MEYTGKKRDKETSNIKKEEKRNSGDSVKNIKEMEVSGLTVSEANILIEIIKNNKNFWGIAEASYMAGKKSSKTK